jgi:CHAD domain-containing protein
MDALEVEWQFDAVDVRPVERWLTADGRDQAVGPGRTRQLVDTYADTDDWRLYRAGLSLRLRRRGRQVEATMKSMAGLSGGIRRRRELTEPLSSPDLDVLHQSQGPIGARVRAVAGPRRLRPLFEIRTRRTTFPLLLDGDVAGEVALDRTTIPVGTGQEPARLRRVEVEVADATVPAVRDFVKGMQESCGLHPATVSKFEAALLATGQEVPGGWDLGPTTVGPGMTIGEVAFAGLRRHLSAVLLKEPGARLGEDIEELHDMRVATRRLRAAMALFSDVLPVRAARLRDEMAWVAGALGSVRDLDVQLEQLERWIGRAPEDREALGSLRWLLQERRTEARRQLLEALDSPRFDRFISSFIALVRRGPLRRSRASRAPAEAVAPQLIGSRYRAARKAGGRIRKRSEASDYHRLRIRCKRLRYAIEFLAPIYGDPAAELAGRLAKVQDALGKHQDAVVAVDRLRQIALEERPPLPPATVFAMGQVAGRYQRQMRRLRKAFPSAYAGISGRPWRDLSKAMKRAQPGAPVSAPPALARSSTSQTPPAAR